MSLSVPNTSNRIITEKYELFWFDQKTIYIRFYEEAVCELEDIVTILNFQIEQGVNQTHDRLIHAEPLATINREAREYLQKNAPVVRSEAYVIPSLAQKILFNVYVKLRKNANPIKAFDQLDNALAWLRSQ